MAITCDPVKQEAALRDRKLDFFDAAKVLDGNKATIIDDRFDYGEPRFISAGVLNGRMVVMVWTPRGSNRHVISMRHCHAKEAERWQREIDRQTEAGFRKDVDR